MSKVKHTSDTYDKIADKYAEMYFDDKSDLPYIDKFLSYLNVDSKILDVGCGLGNFAFYMKEKGFDVVGIDLSKKMLEFARNRVKGIDFKIMDMRNLKFQNNSFEGILCAYSIIHIPSKEIKPTLKELYRVLVSKGKIMIIVQRGDKDKIVDEPLKEGEKIFINFFDPQELSKSLEESDFNILFSEVKENNDLDSLSDEVICIIAEKS